MVWKKLKQLLVIVIIFSICTSSHSDDPSYDSWACGSSGKIYAVFFGCLIASSVIYKLVTDYGFDDETAGGQIPRGSTNKLVSESDKILDYEYSQSDIYHLQPEPVVASLQDDRLIITLSSDKNLTTTEPTTSTASTAAPIPYGKIIGGSIAGAVVLVGTPLAFFLGYGLFNGGRVQARYSSALYNPQVQRVTFQGSGQKVIRDAVPPKVKLIQYQNIEMLDAGDDVMERISEIRKISEKARKPLYSGDAVLRLDYEEGNYPVPHGRMRKPSTIYDDYVSSNELGAVGGERRVEGKVKNDILKEYKSGDYLNKTNSFSQAKKRLYKISEIKRSIFAEIDYYLDELTVGKEIRRLYHEQGILTVMENKLYEKFPGLKHNQIPMEDLNDAFTDDVDDSITRCKRSGLNCRNGKYRHDKARIKTKIKREMGLSNTHILEKMDGVDVQEKYFLMKGKVTKKTGSVFSRAKFSRSQITKLRRVFPRIISKVRSAAFRSTIVGIIPDVLIEGFFLGMDLSEDIPRWKSQSDVSADIMKQDDILKYVSKIWFWGMFVHSTEKRNAEREMDLLTSQAYSQAAGGIDQSNMMLDAMLAMPEKVALENSGNPIQRWEFPDGSVLYRVILKTGPFQSGGRRAASAQNENTSFGDMGDFDLMMLGMAGQSVERFVITKKTKGSTDEEIILASGSALSILMHELDILMEAYRKVQVSTEQILQIYMDHVFETVDVEKNVSASTSQYIGSAHALYTFGGLFGDRSKSEKQLQDKKEQLRRIFERQRDKKEKESRDILAERLNRFSLMVEWISGEAFRIVRAIDLLSEYTFKTGANDDGVISLLEESVRSRIASGSDLKELPHVIYPLSNSDEAKVQKEVVRKLIEDTHTGLVNIASYFPSLRFFGLPPGIAGCFRNECRNEGVNIDERGRTNDDWCKEAANNDSKYIRDMCTGDNCILSLSMKKFHAVECTASGKAILESEHNDSVKLLGLTISIPDQLIKQRQVEGGSVSIASYQEVINELISHWLSGESEQAVIDSMRGKALTYWDMDSENPKLFRLTPVTLFALYCSISSRHPLVENKRHTNNKDEWGERFRQRFYEVMVRDSHSRINLPPVVMKGSAMLEGRLLPVVFGNHDELPFYQFEYFYQCPNGVLKRFDYFSEGETTVELDRKFEWDVDGSYPDLYKIVREENQDVKYPVESSQVKWTSVRNRRKVILGQFFFDYIGILKSRMVIDQAEGDFELLTYQEGTEELVARFSISSDDVSQHQKTVTLYRELSAMSYQSEFRFLKLRNRQTGYVHGLNSNYLSYVSNIHVKASLLPGRYMLKGNLVHGKGEKEMHFLVTANDWFASTCKEAPETQYSHHERDLLSEACAKDSRYEHYCRTLMGLPHHQGIENTENVPLLLTEYKEVSPKDDIPLTFYKPEKLIPAKEVVTHHQESLSHMMNLFSGEPYRLSNNEYAFLLKNATLLPQSLKTPFIRHFIEQVALAKDRD